MSNTIIEFEHFSFTYRSQQEPTLRDVTLSIAAGEKVLIAGPSGSGKSTLAHCLNGLIPFVHKGTADGRLSIKGRDPRELSIAAVSGMVGTVLQDPDGQFVGLTVGEDIAFGLENRGVPLAEMNRRVTAAAAAVGIEELLGASPQELSGGQKQKTMLAGILALNTDILLFDEPLASLDPASGAQVIEWIDRIAQETGKTVILVEHRLEEVLHRPVDRIIVMEEGRIVADCPPAKLLASEVLTGARLREPLYLSALKYAGCTITEEMQPQHPDKLQLGEYQFARLREWQADRAGGLVYPVYQPLLELKEVTFSYGKRPMLQEVSLTAGKGEMLCIAGRNGAGKSTLSRLICGLYKPDSGRILLSGRDIGRDSVRERAQHIGYVMQNPNHMLSKHLLYDEIALGLRLRGFGEEEVREKVLKTLHICGLLPFREWPVSALSYGQKKRVTIASILVLEPEILILDEPTAGQDYGSYHEMMEFLLELQQRGITVIIITHDMHLMLEYAQRTVVLAGGRKLADGRPENVLADKGVMDSANLRETSLYSLARRAGFTEPAEFVRTFIHDDRRRRQ
ncbi:ABC transporter ATP-binding protein ['Paenibacillus yunnanensis' Narsing Rao et al. 2020]|uniref:ABC transporter ATP-binding protein n=1 Tax=Paenibacillus tengchongensis TaxID=2608684 RepID=UPI00124D0F9D|nr:ABC transporter ATP-binding protein [Paenibacillus tengchongensis]